jgi:hypothetical protein
MIMSKKLCRLIAIIILLVSSSSAVVAAANEDGDVITSLDDAVHKDDNENKFSAQEVMDDATSSASSATASSNDEASRHGEKMTDNINNNESTGITPPSHFYISAYIQTNLHTGLSYFLPLNHNNNENSEKSLSSSYAHIPFLECGAIGSTTAEVPLVSGMLRHVPLIKDSSSNNNEKRRSELEFLEEKVGVSIISSDDDDGDNDNGSDTSSFFHGTNEEDGDDEEEKKEKKQRNLFSGRMKRPSPPTYVVALSPLQITVGGNGNQTQQFDAGDVIFFEDTWLGVQEEMKKSPKMKKKKMDSHQSEDKVKGYIMRAIPESMTDMNVIMLTIPPALHRQWKHKHQRQQQQQQQQQQQKQFLQEKQQESKSSTTLHQEFLSQDKSRNDNDHITSPKAPWWKLSSRIINNKQQRDNVLPKPCSLESDPAFAHPSLSVPTTLSQHFSQHFTKLLRQFQHNNPFQQSSLYDADNYYDLMFPIFVQTAAATIGAVTAFGGVLHLLRTVNPTVAVGFGAVCLIGFGTWGIVWLGEELLDEWEMWRERRRLERRMSESWE